MLYSYKNQYPQELPFRIRMPDGTTRTDPNTFTAEEIQSAGYVMVADPPVITKYQALSWTGTNWDVRDFNQQEIDELNNREKQQLIDYFVTNTQKRLDDFAKTRNYDGILSACTYATDSNPRFSSEGQYCVNVRGQTWAALYTILAEAEAGLRPIPTTFQDIEPELPQLIWPE